MNTPDIRYSLDQSAELSRTFGHNEAAQCLLQLLSRPNEELNSKIFQLNVEGEATAITTNGSHVVLEPNSKVESWSQGNPLTF